MTDPLNSINFFFCYQSWSSGHKVLDC